MKANSHTSYAVIVDGYSSGNVLAGLFKQLGYNIIHIQSTNKLHPYYFETYQPDHYEKTIDYIEHHSSNFKKLCEKLADYKLLFALAGIDSGVYLADQINDYFNLPSNSLRLSLIRKNKYRQRVHLSNLGLRNTCYFVAGSLEKLCAWLKKQNQWPVVLKPLESANSQGVKLCHNLKQAIKSFEQIIQIGINQCCQYCL